MIKTDLKGKNIILGISGGIAAYKSVEFLRLLKKQGANVKVIMTKNALKFVGRTTFEALSQNRICSNLFEKDNESKITHIDWADKADAVVVGPATANIIGKLAGGIGDDALSTLLLSVKSPVMICPSMNVNMLLSPPVQRNLQILRIDGRYVLSSESGELACGTSGPGRLPQPEVLLDRLIYLLTPKDLKEKRILVTAGPTREHIDPVRFISNPSSGKMGFAIAKAAEHRGAVVTLISGPVNLPDPFAVNVKRVSSADDMAKAVFEDLEQSDIVIKTAAVVDYRASDIAEHKIKKSEDTLSMTLKKNIDILKKIGKKKKEGQILVGFAAETQSLKTNATEKLAAKNLDIIAGNIVGASSGFGSNTNKVTLFYRDGKIEPLPELEKLEVAHILLDKILDIKA